MRPGMLFAAFLAGAADLQTAIMLLRDGARLAIDTYLPWAAKAPASSL